MADLITANLETIAPDLDINSKRAFERSAIELEAGYAEVLKQLRQKAIFISTTITAIDIVSIVSMATGVAEVAFLARGVASKVVVGEGMKRVALEAAKRPNSIILNNMPKFTGHNFQVTNKMMAFNRKWILEQMRSGRIFIDIGADPLRKLPSIFFQMEQKMIKNYLKLHPDAFKVIKL